MGDQLQALDQVRTMAIDLGMKFGPKLLVAILILVAGYLVGRWAGRVTARILERLRLEPPVRAIEDVLRANARVLRDPGPGIRVARLADSRVAIGVNPWVNVPDYGPAAGEINQAILETFRSRNIVIPTP